ncbi:minor tail protein [Exiguobacterium phage phiExGM16]|uniref:hypothetical protein n=1 Tax=Bacillati TaxID=1783272 RepID=UPI003253BAC0
MSVLSNLRGELADELAGDITVYEHVPARAALPAAFVMAGSPYIEQGATFGERLVRFSVVLLSSPGPNSIETVELDERIETVQRRLLAADWLVESVSQPQLQDLNGAEVLAVELAVSTLATFPE